MRKEVAVSRTNTHRKCREGKAAVFDSVVLGDLGKGLCEGKWWVGNPPLEELSQALV